MSDHKPRVFVSYTKQDLEAALDGDSGLNPAAKRALRHYSARLPDIDSRHVALAGGERATVSAGSIEDLSSQTPKMRDVAAELERVSRSLEMNLQSLETLDAPLARSLRKGLALEKASLSD